MSPPPKLLDRVRAEIRVRHYSRRTEEAYVHWIRRYIVYHGRRHPQDLDAQAISAFLIWLATEQRVAASTQNQAFSALLFLYRDVLKIEVGDIARVPRAQVPVRVPVVLTRDEVGRADSSGAQRHRVADRRASLWRGAAASGVSPAAREGRGLR